MCKNGRIWRWVDHTVGHSTLIALYIIWAKGEKRRVGEIRLVGEKRRVGEKRCVDEKRRMGEIRRVGEKRRVGEIRRVVRRLSVCSCCAVL